MAQGILRNMRRRGNEQETLSILPSSVNGIMTREAYKNLAAAVDKQIASGEEPVFGILAYDIKNIRRNTDAANGDTAVKRFCGIVAGIYSRCPVYHVSGDEFVVFLHGDDYASKEALFEVLTSQAKEAGMEAFACGFAEYDRHSDNCVNDVFIRADLIMYQNKNRFYKMTPITSASSVKTADDRVPRKELDRLIAERAQLIAANDKLNHFNDAIVEMLGSIVEVRSTSDGKHVRRIRMFSAILAQHLMEDCPQYGLTEEDVQYISAASALHDIGKILIPDAILLKPGRLTDEEFEIMKTHSEKGIEVLDMFPNAMDREFLQVIKDICLYHHEKYDGKGYPVGLTGNNIPLSAQIVSLADCFDALISTRPYKKSYTCDEAFQMICDGRCGVFSPDLMKCFIKSREEFEEAALK